MAHTIRYDQPRSIRQANGKRRERRSTARAWEQISASVRTSVEDALTAKIRQAIDPENR